jgi:hypothetical protein
MKISDQPRGGVRKEICRFIAIRVRVTIAAPKIPDQAPGVGPYPEHLVPMHGK